MTAIVERFRAARRSNQLTVLEGFHAIKHAVRFGAELVEWVTVDRARLERLAQQLAPDLTSQIAQADLVGPDDFRRLAPHPPPTGTIALARRRIVEPAALLANHRRPVVFLERPTHLGNLGAVVRVAAGAGAGGVLVSGPSDPWHPDAVRGAAGLQYAVGVASGEALPATDRPIVALVVDGERLEPAAIPSNAVLAFGTERDGLSTAVLERATHRWSLPMQPGVASLNLATAVAATLYAWALAGTTSNSRSMAAPSDA